MTDYERLYVMVKALTNLTNDLLSGLIILQENVRDLGRRINELETLHEIPARAD